MSERKKGIFRSVADFHKSASEANNKVIAYETINLIVLFRSLFGLDVTEQKKKMAELRGPSKPMSNNLKKMIPWLIAAQVALVLIAVFLWF